MVGTKGPPGSGKTELLANMVNSDCIVVTMTSMAKTEIMNRIMTKVSKAKVYTIEHANKYCLYNKHLVIDEAGFIDIDSIMFLLSKANKLSVYGDVK